eukprot:g65792.t1
MRIIMTDQSLLLNLGPSISNILRVLSSPISGALVVFTCNRNVTGQAAGCSTPQRLRHRRQAAGQVATLDLQPRDPSHYYLFGLGCDAHAPPIAAALNILNFHDRYPRSRGRFDDSLNGFTSVSRRLASHPGLR